MQKAARIATVLSVGRPRDRSQGAFSRPSGVGHPIAAPPCGIHPAGIRTQAGYATSPTQDPAAQHSGGGVRLSRMRSTRLYLFTLYHNARGCGTSGIAGAAKTTAAMRVRLVPTFGQVTSGPDSPGDLTGFGYESNFRPWTITNTRGTRIRLRAHGARNECLALPTLARRETPCGGPLHSLYYSSTPNPLPWFPAGVLNLFARRG